MQKEIESFDVVSCLEVIEHVPDPSQLIKACSDLLKPNGQMFLSTLNRNPRSFITAIVGAEYIFNVLPKGTHEWNKFIKPSELEKYMRDAGIKLIESKGMFYNPIFHTANLNNDLGVNYMMHGSKMPKGVLFDLDGTLLDSAPDFIASMDNLLTKHNQPKLDPEIIRSHVSDGSWKLTSLGFNIDISDNKCVALREELLEEYESNLSKTWRGL